MKIPETIQIAGKTVKIIYDEKLSVKESFNGACYADQSEIILDPSLDRQKLEQTFLHEVLHFINKVRGLSETQFDDEPHVYPLSELLYQVIKQL